MKNAQNFTTRGFGNGLEKSSYKKARFVSFVGNFTDDSVWPRCATISIPLGRLGRLSVRGLFSLYAANAMIQKQLKI